MDWDPFVVLKWTAGAALTVGLAWMIHTAGVVVDAYRGDGAVEALELQPLSFTAATIPDRDDAFAFAVAPDTAATALPRVAPSQAAVTDPAIGGGTAELYGRVTGLDEGDVGEVRLTRITDGGRSELTVPVNEDRTWSAADLRGGRYRVRALVPEIRASQGSVLLFLGDGEDRQVDLAVTTPPQQLEFEVVGPEALLIGRQDVVAITVGRQAVDPDGRSVLTPVPGMTMDATFSPVVSLLSARTVDTDSGGAVRYLVSCALAGRATATVSAEDQISVMTLPPCVVELPEAVDG